MRPETPRVQKRTTVPTGKQRQFVDEEGLVLRNYDGERSHDVTVRFEDADGETAVEQTFTLSPHGVASIAMRLPRGVYRVEAELGETRAASRDILVGSGPHETALVEVGNGLVSVAEGVF